MKTSLLFSLLVISVSCNSRMHLERESIIRDSLIVDSLIKVQNAKEVEKLTNIDEWLIEDEDIFRISHEDEISKLEELSLQLTSLQYQLNQIGKTNASLNQNISKIQGTISNLKNGNDIDLLELNKEITSYKSFIDQLEVEIDLLKKENISIDDEPSNSNSDLNNSNVNLYAKYEIASILRAESVVITPIDYKGMVMVNKEYKAKYIDKLKITFNLGDNKVAPKDKKVIFIQLYEPNGTLVYDTTIDGGYYNSADNKEIIYTQKQTINFTNTNQLITFNFIRASNYKFKVGSYTVKIYQDGNYIGQGTVLLT